MRDFIDISLPESLAERREPVGWDGLTGSEREVTCVYLFHWQLLHGGLPAVFTNIDRNTLDIALAGLVRIGAPIAASLMARAITRENVHSSEDIETERARSEIAAIRLELPQHSAAGHPDEFPGPRSLLELWKAMQRRGAQAKPERLIEFERLAEADARSTDRRCETCGQPVPTYRKKCRRCGRPISRAALASPSYLTRKLEPSGRTTYTRSWIPSWPPLDSGGCVPLQLLEACPGGSDCVLFRGEFALERIGFTGERIIDA